jgi:hypothetical protein
MQKKLGSVLDLFDLGTGARTTRNWENGSRIESRNAIGAHAAK